MGPYYLPGSMQGPGRTVMGQVSIWYDGCHCRKAQPVGTVGRWVFLPKMSKGMKGRLGGGGTILTMA